MSSSDPARDEVLERAHVDDPDPIFARVSRRARRSLSLGDYRSALAGYRLAVIVRPESARAWRGLARCYEAVGDHQRAVVVSACAAAVASWGEA